MDTTRLLRPLRVDPADDAGADRLYASFTTYTERLGLSLYPHQDEAIIELLAGSHVVLTTPNRDHNAIYGLPDGSWRHPDHRFEWTRAEFEAWATEVASQYGYRVEFRPVGPVDAEVGPPTQLALFSKEVAA